MSFKKTAKKLVLRLWAVWLIMEMYCSIFWKVVCSPFALKKYALGEQDIRHELSCKIDRSVFSERDRAILKRRLLDGIRLEPLAEEFELSERTVRNICKKHEYLAIK